jgi:hypothetical protein
MSDADFFAANRDMVADELERIAAANRVAPERLALGLAELPEGAGTANVLRALWGPFLTDMDVAVGIAITRHIFRRLEALEGCENRDSELCRN